MDLIRESSFAQYLTQQAREEGIERIEQGGRFSSKCWLCDQPKQLAARIGAIDCAASQAVVSGAVQVPSLEAFRNLLDNE